MASTPRERRPALRVAAYVVAIIFLASGVPKLLGAETLALQFAGWGYPPNLMYLVGLLEVAGAAMLINRNTRWLGAWTLSVLMGGALATHLGHIETGRAVIPVALLLPLLAITRTSRRLPETPAEHAALERPRSAA